MTEPASPPPPDSFPARLLALRHRRGLSQAALARLAGLSRQQVRNYEKGIHEPTLSTLGALALVLSCHPRELLPD